jgi:hypothetical protein
VGGVAGPTEQPMPLGHELSGTRTHGCLRGRLAPGHGGEGPRALF